MAVYRGLFQPAIRETLFRRPQVNALLVLALFSSVFVNGTPAFSSETTANTPLWSEPWDLEKGELRAGLSSGETEPAIAPLERGFSLLQQTVRLPVFFYQQGSDNQDFGRCPFRISCSVFALQAIEQFGAVQGSLMAADRLLRCNPWAFRKYPLSREGYLDDPVEDNLLWSRGAVFRRMHLPTSKSRE